jgi:hypothetical protein
MRVQRWGRVLLSVNVPLDDAEGLVIRTRVENLFGHPLGFCVEPSLLEGLRGCAHEGKDVAIGTAQLHHRLLGHDFLQVWPEGLVTVDAPDTPAVVTRERRGDLGGGAVAIVSDFSDVVLVRLVGVGALGLELVQLLLGALQCML